MSDLEDLIKASNSQQVRQGEQRRSVSRKRARYRKVADDSNFASQIAAGLTGFLLGGIIGLPVSYFLQAGIVRLMCSLSTYIILLFSGNSNDSDVAVLWNTIAITAWGTVVVMGLLGGFFGVWIASKSHKV